MNPLKNPHPNKEALECWIASCKNQAVKEYDFGGKKVMICHTHFERFMKAKEINDEKKKRESFQTEIP